MAKSKVAKKSFPASRKFVLRSDCSVGTGVQTILGVFGLPEGSVRLLLPNGKPARSDKKVSALLKDWGW